MSEDAAMQRSRWAGWAGWALTMVVAPVVYVLGVPPLVYSLGPSLPGKKMDLFAPCPDWVMQVAAPWNWLQGNTFLRKPMVAYEVWWMEKAQW
jgi:hypothetical protein